MERIRYALLLMAALLPLACINDDAPNATPTATPIVLSTADAAMPTDTRASQQTTCIVRGATVYVWADMATGASYFDRMALTTIDDEGSLSATGLYWPDYGTLSFYALCGNFADSQPSATLTEAVTHTVATDQSQQGGNAYVASDLLYASCQGVGKTETPTVLPFYHMMARLQVRLTAADGISLDGASVYFCSKKSGTVTFTPAKLPATGDGSIEQASVRTAMLTAPDVQTDFRLPLVTSPGDYGEAIVVPGQTFAAGDALLRIDIASGTYGGESFYFRPVADVTFTGGYSYTYDITVDATGLTVTSYSIDGWWPDALPNGQFII